MTVEPLTPNDFLSLVDTEKGLVDRRIFSSDQVYQAELEHIFARAWNFMAHESQIPNPGDFFQTVIGEDRVIVVRDKDGQPQVLLNTCRHRGNAVCRAEEGHASSFMCTYHGWTYDLKGALVGVPGYKDYYHEELNREEWGLARAAKVDSYKGFVFATLDPDAPELSDYLGDVGRIGIDTVAERGDMTILGGIQKYVIGCNWKFAVDNVWDYYHAGLTHASAIMAGWFRGRSRGGAPAPQPTSAMLNQNVMLLGEYGHAISGPAVNEPGKTAYPMMDQMWRERPEAKLALGPVGIRVGGHPHIFPNMWISQGQVGLRLPKGPTSTEIWWFTLIDRNLPEEARAAQVFTYQHHFGPAGMFEEEDGENWGQSTRGSRGIAARRHPLNYSMNIGRGEVIEDESGPPRIETHLNEHAQLWHYRSWTEWMAANSWQELRANHSPTPSGMV
jgi:nitrite reductase/ring-hydroxylating ferredoxin subunit